MTTLYAKDADQAKAHLDEYCQPHNNREARLKEFVAYGVTKFTNLNYGFRFEVTIRTRPDEKPAMKSDPEFWPQHDSGLW